MSRTARLRLSRLAHLLWTSQSAAWGHQRTDFPKRDDEKFLAHSLVYRNKDGSSRVEYLPVTITRWPPGERVYGRQADMASEVKALSHPRPVVCPLDQMSLPRELIQLLKDKRQPALFVGAGVSVQACIPLGSGVIQELKKRYPDRLKKNPKYYSYTGAFKKALPGKEHRSERRRLFEDLCAGKAPTEEHYSIAHLVNHKRLSTVFTTNFDHLTELALTTRCSPPPQVYMYDEDIEPPEYSGNVPKLLKLHGDLLFNDMANLEEELRLRLRENMRLKLRTHLQDRGLVVVGYGGNDKTIMKFLEQVVEAPDGIRDGLWWVIYDRKEKANKRLRSLIKKTRKHGKRAHIVGPMAPKTFLEMVCRSQQLDLPKPIPFGIKPGETHLNYTERFGRSRQLPPLDVPERPGSDQEGVLEKLRKAVKKSGVVWLCGPPRSGKSATIAKLAKEFDPKRLFYFSHRFAHIPVPLSLRHDIERLAGVLGIPVVSLNRILYSLFRRNVVLVFDDLFSTNPGTDALSPLFGNILEIITAREQARRGNIIIVAPCEPTEEAVAGIGGAMLRGACIREQAAPNGVTAIHTTLTVIHTPPRRRPPAFPSRIPDAIKTVLSVMSLVRTADFPDVLAKISDVSYIRSALKWLAKRELVEQRGGKYVLRDSVQTFFQISAPGTEAHRLDLAKKFEAISFESTFFRRFHYAIEAEAHYRQAGRYAEALKQLLMVADSLIAAGEEKFVFDTLRDYLLLVTSGRAVFSALEPGHLLSLFGLWNRIPFLPSERPLVEEVISNALSELAEGYQEVFHAYLCYSTNDLENARGFLLDAEEKFRTDSNSKELAVVQLELSTYEFERAETTRNEKESKKALECASSWARKAEDTYSRISDYEGVAKARDHIAKTWLDSGRYEDAFKEWEKTKLFHAEREGFTPEKGVVYGNLFLARLRLGDTRSAEGYFHESNLNFAHVGNWAGVLRNFYFLFLSSIESKERSRAGLPPPYSVYHVIIENAVIRAENREGMATLRIARLTNDLWFRHNKNRKGSLLLALRDSFRLSGLSLSTASHQVSAETLEERVRELTYERLCKVGIIVEKYRKPVLQKVLDIVERESPAAVDFYTCYSLSILEPQHNLDKLLREYKLAPNWKEVFMEVQHALRDAAPA